MYPPYIELRQIDYKLINFETKSPVHSVCVERGLQLLQLGGSISMIVPLALVSTQRMEIVQKLLEESRSVWYANFAWRPAKLFDQVNRALTIFVAVPQNQLNTTFSTGYQKWVSDTRETIVPLTSYVAIPRPRPYYYAPKLSRDVERGMFGKMLSVEGKLGDFVATHDKHAIYYRTTGGLYWKVFTDFPPAFFVNGERGHSSRETTINLSKGYLVKPAIAALSSDVFWWWYTLTSNLRDLNPTDIKEFPIPVEALDDQDLLTLGEEYLEHIQVNSSMLVREQKRTGRTETQSFKIRLSKAIIDKIDQVLAKHYNFTDKELDFIINYDIKYRMGDDLFDEEDDG